MTREHDLGLRVVLDDWLMPPLPVLPDTPDLSRYVAGLPGASGEFTGTFDQAAAAAYLPEPDGLFPVDVDTGPGAAPVLPPDGSVLTIASGNATLRFDVIPRGSLTGSGVRIPAHVQSELAHRQAQHVQEPPARVSAGGSALSGQGRDDPGQEIGHRLA